MNSVRERPIGRDGVMIVEAGTDGDGVGEGDGSCMLRLICLSALLPRATIVEGPGPADASRVTGDGGDESTMTGFDHDIPSSISDISSVSTRPCLSYGSNRTGLTDRKRFEVLLRVCGRTATVLTRSLALPLLAVDLSTSGRYGASFETRSWRMK